MLAQIVLFDGFDALDALAPYEVLDAGGAATGGRLRVELVTVEGPREVRSGGGPEVRATATLDPERADIVIVPGAAGPIRGDGPHTIPTLIGQALTTQGRPRRRDPLRVRATRHGLTGPGPRRRARVSGRFPTHLRPTGIRCVTSC